MWVAAHIVLVKDGEAAGVVFVSDSLGGRERFKGQELAAVDGVYEILAQPQRVEAEVHLEQRYDYLQRRQLFRLVACAEEFVSARQLTLHKRHDAVLASHIYHQRVTTPDRKATRFKMPLKSFLEPTT